MSGVGRLVRRTHLWPSFETGGEFVPVVAAGAAFDPATGFDWSEQLQLWLPTSWFAPEASVESPLPFALAPINPGAGFDWSEQPATWQQPPWFAPDPSIETPIPDPFLDLDAATADKQEQPQAWSQPPWHAPDAETSVIQPPAAAAFDPSTGFPYDGDPTPSSTAQQWFAPEAAIDLPLPFAYLPVDAATLDRQEQPAAWQQPPWFAPEAEVAGVVPITPVAFNPATGFPYDGTQPPTLPPPWEAGALADLLAVDTVEQSVVDVSDVASRAVLWIDQQPERWLPTTWYNPAVEPVDGPLQSWLFTTGAPGTGTGAAPAVLINAENGDIFLSIGGNLIVPGS